MRATRSPIAIWVSLTLVAAGAAAAAVPGEAPAIGPGNGAGVVGVRGDDRAPVRLSGRLDAPGGDVRSPPAGFAQPPPWQTPGAVERGELGPLLIPDASGLPFELWRGLDLVGFEGLLAGLELPPRSFALYRLWHRLLLSGAAPPGGTDAEPFAALRLEALYRSGLLADMGELVRASEGTSAAGGPIVAELAARRDIGLGQREAGCQRIKALEASRARLPERLKGELQLLAGYCSAVAGDAAGAGLAAELAREERVDAPLPLAVLAGIATARKPRLELPHRPLLLDYRFLELLGPVDVLQVLDTAEPALLAALAADARGDPRVQAAAAQAALRVHALAPEAAADAYRRLAEVGGKDADAEQQAEPLVRRSRLVRAAQSAQAPDARARCVRALIDDGRMNAMRAPLARLIAPDLAALAPSPALAAFADTAIEIALEADDFARARSWASDLPVWSDLIDIVDAQTHAPLRLAAVTELAVGGRLAPHALHRLVTVLDALDIDVPIPLWDAASRTPQPASGYLPDTGILAELAQAARRGEVGHTALLVMRALGPHGAEGAHVLALRDGVRALQRVGLGTDARRLALEALLPVWPRADGSAESVPRDDWPGAAADDGPRAGAPARPSLGQDLLPRAAR